MSGSRARGKAAPQRARAVVARVVRGRAREAEGRFTTTFTVGRGEGCELQLLDEGVAPNHVQVTFDGVGGWWVRNLARGGTFLAGTEIEMVPLQKDTELEIGRGGPLVSLSLAPGAGEEEEVAEAAAARAVRAAPGRTRGGASRGARSGDPSPGLRSEEQILQRLRARKDAPAGRETLIIRRAFDRAHRRFTRGYKVAIGVAVLLLAGAGGVIWYQQQRLAGLRRTAEQLFYAMKSVEVETGKLEELVLLHADPREVAELNQRQAKLRQMEREYDAFVQELRIYARATPEDRAVLRVARLFGECEVNVPAGFVAEVERYVKLWQSTGRLVAGLKRARERGYAAGIERTFAAADLPPQYLFLALQESNFDERAMGPATRFGYAKGMWQFISLTGKRYGLHIGPRFEQRVYDPDDERFDWRKATAAAARYIRELTDNEAQGSGLLVMASYNWGEHNIRAIIEGLPENPRERNFWRLLADRRVPKETYDYVLSIVSAAVICEEPGVFGFGGECPGGA